MFQIDFSYQQFVSATLYCAICKTGVTGEFRISSASAEQAVVDVAKSRGWLVAEVEGEVLLACCPSCRNTAREAVLAC